MDFLYTAFEVLLFVFLFQAADSKSLKAESYYRPFLFGSAISTTLRFGIIYEIFKYLFKRYRSLRETAGRIFRWSAALLFLLAVGVASGTFSTAPPREVLYVIDRTVGIMQCGLVISMFLFSRFFALSWRSVPFGIALGFGVLESMSLASGALRTHIGSLYFWDFFVMGNYHLCVLIWLFYVLLPEEKPSLPPSFNLPEHALETWEQELHKVLHQ